MSKDLRKLLHEEQSYIFEEAEKLGAEIELVRHTIATNSCAEKLGLLHQENFPNWTLERVVKALYFSKSGPPYIGVVIPELEKNIDPKSLFTETKLLSSRREAKDYWPNQNYTPKGMAIGTCTPFPRTSSMEKEIRDIIVIGHLPVKYKLVNISVGGEGEEMHRISMHLPYGAIYDILRLHFGEDRIHLYNGEI